MGTFQLMNTKIKRQDQNPKKSIHAFSTIKISLMAEKRRMNPKRREAEEDTIVALGLELLSK